MKFKDSYRKSSLELFEILQSRRQFSSYKINYVKNGMMFKEGYDVNIATMDNDIRDLVIKKVNNVVQRVSDSVLDDI